MQIEDKILWDIPLKKRAELSKELREKPAEFLLKNDTLLLKALSSLSWYELISLFGLNEMKEILTDDNIRRLFPEQKRTYYKNARRLLSEYALSSAK